MFKVPPNPYQPKLSNSKKGLRRERPGMLLMLTGNCLYCPRRAMVTFAMTYFGYDSLKVFSYAIFVGLCYIYYAVELPLSGSARHLRRNSTKLTCLEIIGYRIKYNTVLWLLEAWSTGLDAGTYCK